MSKETVEQFERDRYILVKGFLDPFVAKTAMKYTLHKTKWELSPEAADGQIPHTHSVHGDHLMESLFETTWPKMEEITGIELWPSYTFYRVYKRGDILKHHTDRPACDAPNRRCCKPRASAPLRPPSRSGCSRRDCRRQSHRTPGSRRSHGSRR